jgi:hypothetical protein
MTARTAAYDRAQRSAAIRAMHSPESQRETARTSATLLEQEIRTMLNMKHAGSAAAAAAAQRRADLARAAEAMRQERIASERIANLALAREALTRKREAAAAAKRAAALTRRQARRAQPAPVAVTPAKPQEVAPLNTEIAELRAEVAALTAAVSALAGIAPAAPVAPVAPAPAPRKAKVKPEYVATAVKLVNGGRGQYSQTINGTKVAVAWNGADKVWGFACGKARGTAADRGAAVAQVNLLLAKAGLPAVRA